jgi:hypothetical protein
MCVIAKLWLQRGLMAKNALGFDAIERGGGAGAFSGA